MRGVSPSRRGEAIKVFDFLIAGAGSAGCVAARVLAQAGYRVAIIEATDTGLPDRRPANFLKTFGTEQDWGLKTVPQTALAKRQLNQPRGRGLGGSTRINAMIWYPPRSKDLASLASHGGQNFDRQALSSSLAAVTSWVNPQPPRWISDTTSRYLQTSVPAVEAPHTFLRMGNDKGRITAADLLLDGSNRARSECSTNKMGGSIQVVFATVREVVFDHQRAVGLRVQLDGEPTATSIQSEKGIILAAGTFASPIILIQSGIGHPDQLDNLKVKKRVESRDVGNHLADHLIVPIVYRVPDRHPFPFRPTVGDLARWEFASTGPLASNLAESGGIYQLPIGATHLLSASSSGPQEVQVHITPTHYLTYPNESAPSAMTIGVNLCSPRSRGNITIEPTTQLVPPTLCSQPGWSLRIDPAYLKDRTDVIESVAAVQIGRAIGSDPAFQGLIGDELLPGPERTNAETIERAITRLSQTLYHPVGTCRLGNDPQSVVDPTGAVRGTENLYVIDASILPAIPSVNPNATIMMLAHRLACGLIG